MQSVDFTVKEKTYELRLTTRNVVKLEKELKKNPLSIFLAIENNELPTTDELITILYYSLKACHNNRFPNIDSVYDLYDEYIEEGGNLISLIPVILEVYQVSGIIPKDEGTEDKVTDEKN